MELILLILLIVVSLYAYSSNKWHKKRLRLLKSLLLEKGMEEKVIEGMLENINHSDEPRI